jgi:hypothetical protein
MKMLLESIFSNWPKIGRKLAKNMFLATNFFFWPTPSEIGQKIGHLVTLVRPMQARVARWPIYWPFSLKLANFRGCCPEEKVCGQKHICGQFEKNRF